VARHDLLAGDRVESAVGQRRRHHGEVAGGDQYRALAEVQLDLFVDVVLQ